MTDKEKYENQIKDAAKSVFNNASDYIGNTPGFVELEIVIRINTDSDQASISSRKVNVIPNDIGKDKDLSDPYAHFFNEFGEEVFKMEKKSCSNCKYGTYPDIPCPITLCDEFDKWEAKERDYDAEYRNHSEMILNAQKVRNE